MEQHPIPQNIASYEFHLVGDMSLRQFGLLAGGVITALIFYALPLPFYLKWPAVIFFGSLGAALAFMPIAERPLGQWIIAFFKAVFSPTQFVWQKKPTQPEIFKPIPKVPFSQIPIPPVDKTQLKEYLGTLPTTAKNPLEKQEEEFLQQMASLFQTLQPMTTPQEPFLLKKPIQPEKPTVAAKIGPQLPIPTPPDRPNVLVGMVLDNEGRIIEGAILEIRNSLGMPVRALRTNKLGQFTIATPLENDTYEIETEKEGHQFDIIKMAIKGEIIQPIEIRAKA